MKCSCGGEFKIIEGMEGTFCDTCGNHSDLTDTQMVQDVTSKYTEENLKSVRGVPVNRLIVGSESKGRLEISIPIFISHLEQKAIITQQLDLLEYTLNEVKNRGMDIIPKR